MSKESSSIRTFFEKTRSTMAGLQKKINKLSEQKEVKKEKKYLKILESIKEPGSQTLNLSMSSVAKATAVVILLIVLSRIIYDIRDILLLFFVAYFISAALDPTIDYLQSRKIPRGLGIIFIYVLFFGLLIFFLSNLGPLIAAQVLELATKVQEVFTTFTQGDPTQKIPYYDKIGPFINKIMETVDRDTLLSTLKSSLEKVGGTLQVFAANAFGALAAVFQGIANVGLVLVLAFFMTINEKGIEEFFVSLFPSKHSQYILSKSADVKHKVGYWLRGQLVLCFSIGLLTFIGLTILGFEYALTLAMIAGLLEFIPVVGPIISFLLAAPIALNQEPVLVIWVAVLFFVIQELENNLLVPIIMKKSVGLSPIIVMFSMLVGYRFLGITGVILSVPVATILSIFVNDYAGKTK